MSLLLAVFCPSREADNGQKPSVSKSKNHRKTAQPQPVICNLSFAMIGRLFLPAKGEIGRRPLSDQVRAQHYEQDAGTGDPEKPGLPRSVLYCRGSEMSVRSVLGMWVVAAIGSVTLTPALADHWGGGREGGEWKDEYRDGPCKVKVESKDDEYKEEIKCPNGHGAHWRRGEWKDEFWERGCKVKIEAKRDEYKKEVTCEHDD